MIYVHVPFCRSFCTYCGFYSETAPDCPASLKRFLSYAGRVRREAALRREEIVRTLDISTLYIGGGTPSVLPPSVLGSIVSALPYGPFEEFTLEVNPEDVVSGGPACLAELRALGVNRVSMGVQSLCDDILRWMNRRHDAARARKAFRMLREAGFDNVSIDLIFGLPQLSDALWEESLSEVTAWRPEHISAYQLSVESGSALDGSDFVEASDEQCRRQYDLLCARLAAAGYRHYEISNFALPGYEARHNSAYWSRAPYVGLGPGAHSFSGAAGTSPDGVEVRSWNTEEEEYRSEREILSEEDRRTETLMLGLRTAEGVAASALEGSQEAARLLSEGALRREKGRIRIPEDHFFVCDDIIRQVL